MNLGCSDTGSRAWYRVGVLAGACALLGVAVLTWAQGPLNTIRAALAISPIAAQATNEDTPTSPIPFTISGGTGPWSLTAASSDTVLVPLANIAFGGLETDTDRTVTIIPGTDVSGTATITITATDSNSDTAAVSFVLTVTELNDADNDTYFVNEDATLNVAAPGVLANDKDIANSDTLVAVLQPGQGPAHGALMLDYNGAFTYAPAALYYGIDTFKYYVKVGGVQVGQPATVTIYISPVNHAPIAANQAVTTPPNVAVPVTLSATDVDVPAQTLTYSYTNPSHGILSGPLPSLTYTPTTNYSGSDSFTFKANDGLADSNTATVSITVLNHPPVAISNSLTMWMNQTKSITLAASDTDTPVQTLVFTVLTQPPNGSLTGTAPNLRYTPDFNYVGKDAFTFKANDGVADSAAGTVTITVNLLKDNSNDKSSLSCALAGADAGWPTAFGGLLPLLLVLAGLGWRRCRRTAANG